MVEVFGVPMFAPAEWNYTMLNHAASILGELIDNDNDGCADDLNVLNKLVEPRKCLAGENCKVCHMLVNSDDDMDDGTAILEAAGYIAATAQWLGETIPQCSGLNFTPTCCDASIEEIFHLVTSQGHSFAYPGIFGNKWRSHSSLTDAMDIAR